MENISPFCTCKNLNCPLHPTRHDQGCAPCVRKNLRLQEIPACFFDRLENAEARQGDTFRDFAELAMRESPQ